MIPSKKQNVMDTSQEIERKVKNFSIFDVQHFIRRIIRSWYWFVLMFTVGYAIAYVYIRYYAQRIYSSDIILSVTKNSSSYNTSSQSINFIWGQTNSTESIQLKKMLLSRSHNEILVKELKLYVNYKTAGLVRETFMDKNDSPFFFEIDENHLQQVDYPIFITPKGDKYEISFPGQASNKLYDYYSESFKNVKSFASPQTKTIALNEWFESPNLRFRLVPNPAPSGLEVPNVIITLSTVNSAVRAIVGSMEVNFDREIASIMQITKKGYNLNETVNFLNASVEFLKDRKLRKQTLMDKNSKAYIDDNLGKIKYKLDSAAGIMNELKVKDGLYDIEDLDRRALEQIKELDAKKAEVLLKMNSLSNIKGTLLSNNIEKIISTKMAGFEDAEFATSVTDLQTLQDKKSEIENIYQPNSEPIKEINRKIKEAQNAGAGSLNRYSNTYLGEIKKIDDQIRELEGKLSNFPEKERKYLDAKRGYEMIESTYTLLQTKQHEIQIRLASQDSDIEVIDPAKNIGQGPISPNISNVKTFIILLLLLLPLIIVLLRELLDNKVRNLKEVLSVTKIPFLGVIGRNVSENNLAVINQSKSSVAEAFRSVRSHLRFIGSKRENSQVFLVTSSVGGEGKTFVSINLASVLALGGKKTILLGMDLRKPKIFGDFKLDNSKGISNYLVGSVTKEEIIKPTQIPSLFIATAGEIPPNPSELLMSDKNHEFIEQLREEFDYIVIDSPPVGLVTDSFDLMKYSDANVYVVRHEYTEKYMLKMIAEKYQNKEVSNLAVVYNDADHKNGYGYGYGYGYDYFDEDAQYELPFLPRIIKNIRMIFSRK